MKINKNIAECLFERTIVNNCIMAYNKIAQTSKIKSTYIDNCLKFFLHIKIDVV